MKLDTYFSILKQNPLIPQTIKLAKILHFKKLGIKYVGNDNYEKTGGKKFKWYEWLR